MTPVWFNALFGFRGLPLCLWRLRQARGNCRGNSFLELPHLQANARQLPDRRPEPPECSNCAWCKVPVRLPSDDCRVRAFWRCNRGTRMTVRLPPDDCRVRAFWECNRATSAPCKVPVRLPPDECRVRALWEYNRGTRTTVRLPPDDCRVRAFWECNRAASAQATALDRRPDPGKRVELQGLRMCGADRCNCLQLHGDWLCRHKV